MDAAAELGRNQVQCEYHMEMSRLTRDGAAEPVSRDQILRRKRGQGNIHFPRSADHDQDWQPYLVDLYSCYKVANPARGQLNTENEYFPVPVRA